MEIGKYITNMKHLKKFNESKNYDYEITDYFVDLEDDGIINIKEIKDQIGESVDAEGVYKRNMEELINNIRGIKKANATYEIENYFVKYLDYFSLQTPDDFFDFYYSDKYIPFMTMSIYEVDSTKHPNWIYKINESIKRCEESSLVTTTFGISNIHHFCANVFFIQSR